MASPRTPKTSLYHDSKRISTTASRISQVTFETSSTVSRQPSKSYATLSDSSFRDSKNGSDQFMGAIAPRCSSRSSAKAKKKLAEFTINKLRYNEVGIHGRDKELEQLKDAFESCTLESERHVAFTSGVSGSGKTYLTNQFYSQIRVPAFYIGAGKFDRNQTHNVPYAGFSLAVEKFYASLLELKVAAEIPEIHETHPTPTAFNNESPSNMRSSTHPTYLGANGRKSRFLFTYDDITTKLRMDLDEQERDILVRTIPVMDGLLHGVVGESFREKNNPEQQQQQGSTNESNFSQAKIQFNQAFKKFIRLLCSFAPVVLNLDDIQWADGHSLELLEEIISDYENDAGIFAIASYRSCEVETDHLIRKMVERLETKTKREKVTVTNIEVGNLNVEEVNAILSELMADDSSRVLDFAKAVHKKTLGNPLFVIQYMKSLAESDAIQFQFGRHMWDWNLEEIERETNATDNVLDLMTQKLKQLPPNVANALPLAASLGFSFPAKALDLVLQFSNNKFDPEKENPISFDGFVTKCVDEGIMESFGDDWYSWVHDKLAEAAIALIEKVDLDPLQYSLGQMLVDNLTGEELERSLFVVVFLLNKGAESEACRKSGLMRPERRQQTAELNMRAGRKAMKSSSFGPAAAYFNQGISLLPEDHWQSQYELSLELYSTAAQAEYSTGDFVAMQKHCDAVIAQKDRPLLDKRRVYNAVLDSIGAQDRMGDAAALCVEILEKLGCRFPKRGAAFCTIAGLIRIVMAKKKRTPEKIAKYEIMKDPAKIWAMNLLDKLFTFWYQDKNDNVPLAILKSQRWTIKYGVCDVSMPNFASVGFMLAAFLGDFEGGEIFANHSLELLDRAGSEAIKSRTILVAYGSNLHWRKPFNDCLKPLLEGYNVGMKMGDVESALYCVLFYLWFSLFLGTPLSTLAPDLETYASQMSKFQQNKHLSWTKIFLQTVLNLMGAENNANSYRLIGEVMNEDEMMQGSKDIHILKPALNLFQMYAMFYFGEHERAVKILEDNEDGYFEKSVPGISMLMVNAFQSAISCIQVAKKTKKPKYRRMAKKFKDKIDDWVKKGNPNVLQYQALIDAEWADLAGKKNEAAAKYEVAILMAGRRGLLQDRAVAHQLCSSHLLSTGDQREAARHAWEAIGMYEEWGADAVADRVRRNNNRHFTLQFHSQ